MGRRILGKLTTTKTDVPTATFKKVLNLFSERQHLTYKRTGFDFYVFHQEEDPVSTDEGWIINENYTGEFWDGESIPTGSVWIHHTEAGNEDFFIREG